MKLASRDQILNADDLPSTLVPTPEWGKDTGVKVRSLGSVERDKWDQETYQSKTPDMVGLKARFCALTIVDENGEQIFTPEDAAQLQRKNSKVIDRIFAEAAKLNGLLAVNVDDAEKKSEGDPSPAPTGN